MASTSQAFTTVHVRLSEYRPVKDFLVWAQEEFYPLLNTEAPQLKTEFERALARLFAECVTEEGDAPEP